MFSSVMGVVVQYAAVWITVLGGAYLVIRSANWFYGDDDSECRIG